MCFESLIFDLDGVLIDSEVIFKKAMSKTFADFEMPLDDAEVAFMLGRSSRDLIPEFLTMRGVTDQKEYIEVLEAYLHNHNQLWEAEIRLMPFAAEVIRTLRHCSVPLAIATASRSSIVARFIEKFGFKDVFRCVVSGDMVNKRKPDPEVYNRVIDLLGVPREGILVIEDTDVGVRAAKAAGLACAAVWNEHSASHDFSMADYVFPTLKYIPALF